MSRKEWTLTQIANLLGLPQYKLIYLCEKGVIVTDGVDAKGRGSSRRFSARNMFEFLAAFTLGDFHVRCWSWCRRFFQFAAGTQSDRICFPWDM